MSGSRVALASILLGLGFGPREAGAQSAQRSAAVALFDEAESLMSEGKYAEACPKYAESYRLDPQLGVALHLGDCYEQNQKLASSWAAFKDAADIAERRGDERLKLARDRVAALVPRLSRLRIVVPEETRVSGLEITRDGIVIGPALWGSAVPVDQGEHSVRATAPGRTPWTGKVAVQAEGKTESITVRALAMAADSEAKAPAEPLPVSPKAPASPAAESGGGSFQPVLGYTSIGLGAVGLGVGIVFMIKRGNLLDERDELCPGNHCTNQNEITRVKDLTDEAKGAATIGTVGLVAGGVLAAGGVILVLTSPQASHQVAIAPALGTSFRGVNLSTTLW